MRWWIVLMLLFAGCAGDAPGPKIAQDQDDNLRGTVTGQVVTDAGRDARQANVRLETLDLRTTTNDTGHFVFEDVPAGRYNLTVMFAGYVPAVRSVVVPGGQTVDVPVVLVLDTSTSGPSAHVHDYWQGRTTLTMMDASIDLGESPPGSTSQAPVLEQVTYTVMRPNTGASRPIPVPENEPPALVAPGTGLVRVVFEWDVEDVGVDAMGLEFSTAATNALVSLDPRPPGEAFEIVVNASEVDDGHQWFTFWTFHVVYGNDVRDPTSYSPAVAAGDLHVVIELEKGRLPPIDPPHPDFWTNGSLEYETSYQYRNYNNQRIGMELEEGLIMPPGIGMMRLEFTWQRPATDAVLDEYELIWRTADQHPTYTPRSDYRSAAAVDSEPGRRVYEVEVEPRWCDGYYQQISQWRWLPTKPGNEEDPYDLGTGPRDFHLKITLIPE